MLMLETAKVTLANGVQDDFRGKPGKRQVTVLSFAAWQDVCDELSQDIAWQVRRSNLLIDDINLVDTVGQKIFIGDLVLEITQETDPCERMEEAQPGLFNALAKSWRGGVCCRVIRPGVIKVGDEVEIV